LNFNHIIGHDKIKEYIDKSLDAGQFSHAHLFVGEDGIGKSLLAKAAAVKVLGKATQKQYADIIEFRVEKNKKSIGVDVVRGIIEEVNKKPYEGDKKVVIIYEGDKMTTEAQNAFLKTIEEPPKGVYIFVLSENLEAVLDTVKSRCQIHKLQRLDREQMTKFLDRDFKDLSVEQRKAIVSFSDGIPGRAERYINDSSLKEIRSTVIDIMKEICKHDGNDVLNHGAFFTKYKNKWQEVLTWFLSYIRDIMVYKETGNKDMLINVDKYEDIKDLSNMFSFNKLNDIIDIIKDTRTKLDRNVNLSLVYNVMLLKMKEV